jgi:hypothetical protein
MALVWAIRADGESKVKPRTLRKMREGMARLQLLIRPLVHTAQVYL